VNLLCKDSLSFESRFSAGLIFFEAVVGMQHSLKLSVPTTVWRGTKETVIGTQCRAAYQQRHLQKYFSKIYRSRHDYCSIYTGGCEE
jgi:hypothetical protein